MAIAQELLDILACPRCKGPVRPVNEPEGLVCDACRLQYPVEDDIPVMLVDEAVPLDAADSTVKKQK
ncbi:MAG: uncharacterized protein PWP34_175 [Desulfuromonadales bacterium]|jgi:uncharacterized protein YbaR (Trm112 family)|nr:uncharacterized protein [Desulfuromonadales bacterium]